MLKVYKSPVLTSGMLFNIEMGYGDGILPCYIDYDKDGNKRVFPYALKYKSVKDQRINSTTADASRPPAKDWKLISSTFEEVTTFFEENDINGWLLEQLTDLNFFYNVFPEIGFNLDDHGKRKIVELTHKEATFSRWEVMNPKNGRIEKHFFSTKWAEKYGQLPASEDVFVTDVLDYRRPLRHLREVMDDEAKKGIGADKRINRWIVPVNFPTPGRTYYQKPYWYSIIESGWYDFIVSIPKAKNAIMNNRMSIKYHVQLSDKYFPNIFKYENITEKKDQDARVKKEFEQLNKYLSGSENNGKSVISYTNYTVDGKELPSIKITKVDDAFPTGEYIEDSEEASNILSVMASGCILR